MGLATLLPPHNIHRSMFTFYFEKFSVQTFIGNDSGYNLTSVVFYCF